MGPTKSNIFLFCFIWDSFSDLPGVWYSISSAVAFLKKAGSALIPSRDFSSPFFSWLISSLSESVVPQRDSFVLCYIPMLSIDATVWLSSVSICCYVLFSDPIILLLFSLLCFLNWFIAFVCFPTVSFSFVTVLISLSWFFCSWSFFQFTLKAKQLWFYFL